MTSDCCRIGTLVSLLQNEFLEIPHLSLTPPEAERRFGVDRATCEAILNALVESGVLARTDDGTYVRFFPLAHAA